MLTLCFWISGALLVYIYAGYGLMAWCVRRVRGAPAEPVSLADHALPSVTVLIAAHNERHVIAEKLRNTLSLDYPADLLHVLVVTDGSDDGTEAVAAAIPGVRVLHAPARKGKIAAVERAMAAVQTPIVVFTDADTMCNAGALRAMVRHFADPRVAAVAGEKRVRRAAGASDSARGEGLYWRYESALKQLDHDIGTVVGAAGELFAMRSSLWVPVEPDTLLDDFMITMRLVMSGNRVAYEPLAWAEEGGTVSFDEELKRKVRIAAGGFQSMTRLPGMLDPRRHGVATWQYLSHRAARWAIAPACLPVLFVTSALLAARGSALHAAALAGQCVLYGGAWAGWRRRTRAGGAGALVVPLQFVLMHAAVFAGLVRWLRGRQPVTWERARKQTSISERADAAHATRRA